MQEVLSPVKPGASARKVELEKLSQALQVRFPQAEGLARELLRRNWLTPRQVRELLGDGRRNRVGPYVVLELLGEGGTSKIYKARHPNMERPAALKIIRKDRLGDTDAVWRFLQEVRLLSRLSHPNIVRAYDAGQAAGTYFLAMELIDGIDLERLVRSKGPLPIEQAVDFICQAATGLQHAHDNNVIHRDIKPANLMVTAEGAPPEATFGLIKILDFGLARLQPVASETDGTECGIVQGTPDFISPEQALSFKDVDSRTDLYSLGCTFYFLLSGRAPFLGSPLGKLVRHQVEQPPPLCRLRTEVPSSIAAVVHRLMAKDPARRYQTPAELTADLGVL